MKTKTDELKKEIIDGKAIDENALTENKKIKDCNPSEKSDKIKEKKLLPLKKIQFCQKVMMKQIKLIQIYNFKLRINHKNFLIQ